MCVYLCQAIQCQFVGRVLIFLVPVQIDLWARLYNITVLLAAQIKLLFSGTFHAGSNTICAIAVLRQCVTDSNISLLAAVWAKNVLFFPGRYGIVLGFVAVFVIDPVIHDAWEHFRQSVVRFPFAASAAVYNATNSILVRSPGKPHIPFDRRSADGTVCPHLFAGRGGVFRGLVPAV